jgi:hypothetical protein
MEEVSLVLSTSSGKKVNVSGDIEDAADGLKYKVGIYSGYDIVEHNAERA